MIEEQIKVSIVFTVRDGEKFIHTSIRMALAIDYPNFEVVIVDDGSTDQTRSICESIKDSRLHYYYINNAGRAKALNFGIKNSRGELIAINDADDLSLSHRIRSVMPQFDGNKNLVLMGTECVTTSVFLDEIPEKSSSSQVSITPISTWRLYRNNVFVHSTVVFRKAAWAQINGYDESLNMCIDYDFFLRVMTCGQLMKLSEPTVIYYDNPTSHFKRRSPIEYLQTNLYIRERARKKFGLPFWARCLNLLQYYQYARVLAKAAFRSSK